MTVQHESMVSQQGQRFSVRRFFLSLIGTPRASAPSGRDCAGLSPEAERCLRCALSWGFLVLTPSTTTPNTPFASSASSSSPACASRSSHTMRPRTLAVARLRLTDWWPPPAAHRRGAPAFAPVNRLAHSCASLILVLPNSSPTHQSQATTILTATAFLHSFD